MTNRLTKDLFDTVNDYELALVTIIKQDGPGSLIAAHAVNKHNPGLLSQTLKETEDGKANNGFRKKHPDTNVDNNF